ncbi:acyl carrier protein [Amycolatopsis sp. K13G38]|uniref:Acyl carrier protein n=1 Tax=Amycolatopsis acididurans TaxID=2724524 RepID=A0ABX1IWF7_9PSEU|nr:phosphopantetheine-binding protein [Amycolatopsis acididurans]NKQ51825.1 acyl carrier protein [Amycolatopsis acididurans]
MTSQTTARADVYQALRGFATETELDALGPDENLRDALELDSMDFLTFVERLSTETGHRIDEDDYPRLVTLGSCIEFLTGA